MTKLNFDEIERGFLFIDLRDSMGMVAALGLKNYSQLLTHCFELLENCRQQYPNIELHQYAGDAAIFTWQESQTTAQAILLFQDFTNQLQASSEQLQQYSTQLPYFSAAINTGVVTEHHLGNRRIFYGNAINATARLQGLCKHYDTPLLISEQAHKHCNKIPLQYLNRVYLKGLSEAMDIYGLESH